MTLVTFLKRLTPVALVCTTFVASAAASRGPENSTLQIGLRLLSACELRTSPARASCSTGTPMTIAQPAVSNALSLVAGTGQDASALSGPAPAGRVRFTTVAF